MELIADERLRGIVEMVVPLLEKANYPDLLSPPEDEAERAAWFEDIATRRAETHEMVLQMVGRGSGAALPDGVEVIELAIPVTGTCGNPTCEECARGAVTAYVYRPSGATDIPAYITLHGGGWWLMGGREILRPSAAVHAALALEVGIAVVDLDYRLAPEHKFPLPVEDCYATLSYVVDHASELGVDPERMAMGGGSAGGNLTAAVALMCRDRAGRPSLRAQVLNVPVLESSGNTESHRLFAVGYGAPYSSSKKMWGLYLRDPIEMLDPYASPMNAVTLRDLPPALVVVGEYDGLRDEGLAYGQRLAQDGVTVTMRCFPMIHGAGLPENSSTMHKLTVDFLRANLFD